jgi:hypothetical protein
MNFTKTYANIQIEEIFEFFRPKIIEPYLGTLVPGLRGIRKNLKYLPFAAGCDIQKGDLFREIAMCINLTNQLPTKFVDYSISVMYQKIAEEKSLLEKQGKRYFFTQEKKFAIICLKTTQESSAKGKLDDLKKCVDTYSRMVNAIFDPERLYKIIKFENSVILEMIKKWKATAFGPRIGRKQKWNGMKKLE